VSPPAGAGNGRWRNWINRRPAAAPFRFCGGGGISAAAHPFQRKPPLNLKETRETETLACLYADHYPP